MKHLETGILRRSLDEPAALVGSQRRHLADCPTCRRRSSALATQARVTALALGAVPPLELCWSDDPATSPHAAGRAVRRESAGIATLPSAARRGPPVAFWGACAGAMLVVLFLAKPLGSLAQGFLAIFEPRQFVALPISRTDVERMRALPDLANYGTVREIVHQRRVTTVDAARAAALARFPMLVPTFVPFGVPPPEYRVISPSATAFTFSAAKAAAAAAAAGQSLSPMPAGLDGSTLQASVGPAIVALYLTAQERTFEQQQQQRLRGDRGDAGSRSRGERRDRWPKLLVVQMPVPTISSNGVSAATLIQYVAAQPGLPPQVAAQLHAIGDPTATLPIPIPIDRMHAEPVTVRGAPGLFVGDNTGVGAGVIWQSRGYVYGVAGTLPVRTILAVANSLR